MDISLLSSNVTTSILKINSLDNDQLLKLCKYFLNILIKMESKIVINTIDHAEEILCAIATIILECAKYNSSKEQAK